VTKPPPSTPHSDLDGVHEDRHHVPGSARATGKGAADLARAKEETAGRPPYADDLPNREDRSR